LINFELKNLNKILIYLKIFSIYSIYRMLETINMTDVQVDNFVKGKNWNEKTEKQNVWRINQIINTNDFSSVEKYNWFRGLYKDLLNHSKKYSENNKNKLQIINLQKELELYKQNMSLEQIQATTNLLNTINLINVNKELKNLNTKLNHPNKNTKQENKQDNNIDENKEEINSELKDFNKKLIEDKILLKEEIKVLKGELERVSRINSSNYEKLKQYENTNTEELEAKILQLKRHNEELQKENKQLKIELDM
jgi:hypothetical protein